MNNQKHQIDWLLLQSFAAVAEHETFSAAAKAIGTSQPTMSRHITTLEEQLGVRLFVRTKAGAVLTEAGLHLVESATTMADSASQFAMLASGQQQGLSGTVRITASEIVACFLLPPLLEKFHRQEPDIELEVVASDESENLLRREADIAIRMYRPTQLDVITKHVADFSLGAFAANSYVEQYGLPERAEEIIDHTVVGYDKNTLILDGFRRFGLNVDRDFFAFRCDNQLVCWNMVVAGFGIGFNQVSIGDQEPKVQRVPFLGEVGRIPVWLTAHKGVKNDRRIRKLYDFLAEEL